MGCLMQWYDAREAAAASFAYVPGKMGGPCSHVLRAVVLPHPHTRARGGGGRCSDAGRLHTLVPPPSVRRRSEKATLFPFRRLTVLASKVVVEGASAMNTSRNGIVLIQFPGAVYTQSSAVKAALKVFQEPEWRVADRTADGASTQDTVSWAQQEASISSGCKRTVYFMDYDIIPFELVQSYPKRFSSSSYCIRKALIRKNWLHASVHAYSVKTVLPHGHKKPLDYLPKTWTIDVQFADDLYELLIDDLFDLAEDMQRNEQRSSEERKWWILKAAMADRGMGIRLFSNLDGLREILEEFEENSDDDERDDEEHGDIEELGTSATNAAELLGSFKKNTAVMLGQLRHFIIQEYVNPPLLICPNPRNRPDSYRKFHLRAYVLCAGGLQVYLWDEMLALFAPANYTTLGEAEVQAGASAHPDPRIHITNTCLHADGTPTEDGRMDQGNVHLLSDLCDPKAGGYYAPKSTAGGTGRQKLGPVDLAKLKRLAAQAVGAIFEAAAKGSGCTNWLLWNNCWEIFGVDLLVGWSENSDDEWRMWLLEVNAQPDFAQTGHRLQRVIDELFERSLEIAVKDRDAAAAGIDILQAVGESKNGMTLCFSEQITGAQ